MSRNSIDHTDLATLSPVKTEKGMHEAGGANDQSALSPSGGFSKKKTAGKKTFDWRKLRNSIYFQTAKRLLVIFLLYTLCRAMFLVCNYDFYHERTFSQLLRIFLGGLRFDTTAILYLNSIYLVMFLIPFKFRYNSVYQNIGRWVYFITNGIGLAANCIDIVYFRFTLQRTTMQVFKEFSNEDNLAGIFAESIGAYWYVFLFFTLVLTLMVVCYGRKKADKSSIVIPSPALYYPAASTVFLVCVWLTIVGIRGGFGSSTRPISLNDSAQYIQQPIDVPLVLNTPFSIIRSAEYVHLNKLVYFDDIDEMEQIYTPVHIPADSLHLNDMNVVVIIMESFAKEHIGFYNKHLEGGNYKGYTPFLDSLIDESLTFTSSYGNGRKSVDALASIMLSVPAIPSPYVLSPYYNNEIRALPRLLREEGYETAFFCGQPNSGMGFHAFCNLLGFERFYGMTEYGNDKDYDGHWGIWDEEFLQFTADEISKLKEPFLTSVFNITSHHPFRVPPRYEDVFEAGVLPIHKPVRYADYAFRRFFETASKQPWFENTLFVLAADHINGSVHEEYNNPAGQFAVPIIFYKPDGSLKAYKDEVAQQNDIMPTVLGYLGYNKPYLAFGFDINSTEDRFALNYNNGIYQIMSGKYLLQFNGKQTIALYELHTGMNKNLMNDKPEIVEEMETKIKAYLQQYTFRMVDNKLTVTSDK